MSVYISRFYVTGGTLQRDAPSYIEREADNELYDCLKEGAYCYVLTPRQMGKSSLMVRAAVKLRDEGATVAVIDLTSIGQHLTVEQWYNGLLDMMGQQLGLEDELEEFWLAEKQLGPLQRWMKAIRQVVLPNSKGKVVVFIDEIDAVRSLPFSTDEFFAGVREFYNRRTEDPELQRLAFCLLGVATASDLIRDKRTTPFNIGRHIELVDFSEENALPLIKGLGRDDLLGKRLLKRALHWTGGHPYLTQRFCRAIAENVEAKDEEGADRICTSLFLSHSARERDDNLIFVRERILKSEVDLAALLLLYKRARSGDRVRDDKANPLIGVLRLSGLVRSESGYLKVRNKIYESVFDREWIMENMPDAELRRQRAAFLRGLLGATAVAALIIALIAYLALNLKEQRDDNRQLLYAAHMNLAQQAWDGANTARVLELLESQMPKQGETDLRGFEWYYLWKLCHSDLWTMKCEKTIYSTAISPDGKTVAAASVDGTVKMWDIAEQKESFSANDPNNIFYCAAFSPDGKILAACGGDIKSDVYPGIVKLWDTGTKREIASLSGHNGEVTSLAFSPDGKTLAAASRDGAVKLWDAVVYKEIAALKANSDSVLSVAFSPDGKTLAFGNGEFNLSNKPYSIELWDAAARSRKFELKGHRAAIKSLAFSHDGKNLVSGSYDKTVRIWDASTGQVKAVIEAHKDIVTAVAFCPNGNILATGSYDRTVKLWDLETNRELAVIKGNIDPVNSIAFSPDGKRFVSGSGRLPPATSAGTVMLRDMTPSQSILYNASNRAWPISFTADGNVLAAATSDKLSARLWNVPEGREIALLSGHSEPIDIMAFSPDNKMLATGSYDSTAKLWDAATGAELKTLKGHRGTVISIAFSPDGKILATGSFDSTAKLWDTTTGSELATLSDNAKYVSSLAFSPDGSKLAIGSSKVVKIWDTIFKKELMSFEGHDSLIYSVTFSIDGKRLATASLDRTIKLWDLNERKCLLTLKGHDDEVYCVAFSPDGKRLASASRDKTVKLWDIETGQEVITLKGHDDHVGLVRFSSDGKTLASADRDGKIKLWRMADPAEVSKRKK